MRKKGYSSLFGQKIFLGLKSFFRSFLGLEINFWPLFDHFFYQFSQKILLGLKPLFGPFLDLENNFWPFFHRFGQKKFLGLKRAQKVIWSPGKILAKLVNKCSIYGQKLLVRLKKGPRSGFRPRKNFWTNCLARRKPLLHVSRDVSKYTFPYRGLIHVYYAFIYRRLKIDV